MDEDGHDRVGVKGSSKVDWLSNLPESLLCKILLTLRTKDVVRTSVLSKRWRNLWRYVPGLDLDHHDIRDDIILVSFVDAFLGFNSESYLESFKLKYSWRNEPEIGVFSHWINTVVDQKVKHLHVLDCWRWNIQMPPNLYTCGSLVSLKLYGVTLVIPKFVSLPCLKFMDLARVLCEYGLDLETFISGCPVLESLFIKKSFDDGIQVIRVCSQSLLRFTHVSNRYGSFSVKDDLVVDINAPRLQYLRLGDDHIGRLILNNTGSIVKAYIDTVFNWSFEIDLQKRKMIGSFLEEISCVKDMTITSKTLEVFYHYSKCEQLPLFCNLSFLRISFPNFRWKMMAIFIGSCPNLNSLVVASDTHTARKGLGVLSGPRCLLSSLEYVYIDTPLVGVAVEMKLVSYFLENSVTLKKLTVRLSASLKTKYESAILRELLTIPRLSTSCQVVVL